MSTTTSAQLRILVLCFIFSLFVFGARYRFNRHCPICRAPVLIEWSLTRGVLGYIGDDVVVHKKCHVIWSGNGELLNFFSLKDSDQESLKNSL